MRYSMVYDLYHETIIQSITENVRNLPLQIVMALCLHRILSRPDMQKSHMRNVNLYTSILSLPVCKFCGVQKTPSFDRF